VEFRQWIAAPVAEILLCLALPINIVRTKDTFGLQFSRSIIAACDPVFVRMLAAVSSRVLYRFVPMRLSVFLLGFSVNIGSFYSIDYISFSDFIGMRISPPLVYILEVLRIDRSLLSFPYGVAAFTNGRYAIRGVSISSKVLKGNRFLTDAANLESKQRQLHSILVNATSYDECSQSGTSAASSPRRARLRLVILPQNGV
jgi:hypothetical protein